MIHAGIIGGSGYTAGELIRLLMQHQEVHINFVYSTTNAGKNIGEVHHDLYGCSDLKFSSEVNQDVDVVFLCLGHGNSKKFLEANPFNNDTVVIDLSNDFRLNKDAHFMNKTFVYGLPELYKEKIRTAKAIANPGCFATAIQLALLPMASAGLLPEEIHTTGITGSTGAGVKPSSTSHFSWRNNNISWYKPFNHQHLDEICQSLKGQDQTEHKIRFMPYRGNFTRGILTTNYFPFEGTLDQATEIYTSFYKDAPYTKVINMEPHLKQVVNTNNCFVHLHQHEDQLMVTSMIDNLLKGASGQAVQNMNLIFGLNEGEGLGLKATFF